MIRLEALTRRVKAAIPLSESLAFRLTDYRDGRLTLEAPLAPNHNDKGTFFAGSQSALLTLAGWSLTTLLAEEVVATADVVAVESRLRYRRPLGEDLTVVVQTEDDDRQRFYQRLRQHGRASLWLEAQALDKQGNTVSQYQGRYLARA